MTIIIRRPWTRQPQQAVRTAWNIARPNLLYLPSVAQDIARFQAITYDGSAERVNGIGGVGISLGGTTSDIYFGSSGASNVNNSATFTSLSVFVVPALSSVTTLSQSSFGSGASSTRSQQLRVETDGSIFLVSDDTAGVIQSATGVITQGRLHCIAASWNESTGFGILAANGRIVATATPGAQSWATTGFFALGRKAALAGSTEAASHVQYLYARWNSDLPQEALRFLTSPPFFNIFASRQILIPTTSAGIVTPTLTAASAINVTSTTARARVTFTRP